MLFFFFKILVAVLLIFLVLIRVQRLLLKLEPVAKIFILVTC